MAPHQGPRPGQKLEAGTPAQQKADLSHDAAPAMGRRGGLGEGGRQGLAVPSDVG